MGGATSCRPKHCAVKGDYVYHLVMCVLGQVYVDNAAVRTLIDAMPAESLCQHGGNASPRCESVLASKDEQAAYDQSPDSNKWMYKSFSSEKINERDYDAWVTRASSKNGRTQLWLDAPRMQTGCSLSFLRRGADAGSEDAQQMLVSRPARGANSVGTMMSLPDSRCLFLLFAYIGYWLMAELLTNLTHSRSLLGSRVARRCSR